jgi:hypothetical protein
MDRIRPLKKADPYPTPEKNLIRIRPMKKTDPDPALCKILYPIFCHEKMAFTYILMN